MLSRNTLGMLVVLSAISAASAAAAQDAPSPRAAGHSATQSADKARAAREAFAQGQDAYARGDLAGARQYLARSRELLPSPELAYDLARVHERMGDAQAALALYREYLERGDPSERERAQISRAMQQLKQLQARRQEALKAPPPDASLLGEEARAMFELGVTAYRGQRYEAALAAFLAAKSSVALPELDYNLALTCERLGALRDAIDHYQAFAARLQDRQEAARIEQRIREHEDALSGARAADKSEPSQTASADLTGPQPRPRAAKRPRPGIGPRPR